MWKSYLDEVRDEVRLGSGVFGEDDQLRGLLQECFDQGDALNGIVYWEGCPTQFCGDFGELVKNKAKATAVTFCPRTLPHYVPNTPHD